MPDSSPERPHDDSHRQGEGVQERGGTVAESSGDGSEPAAEAAGGEQPQGDEPQGDEPQGDEPQRADLLLVLRRLPQTLLGVTAFGVGIGLVVRGRNGQGPWTVFHEGVSLHTPLTIGTVAIITSAALVVFLVFARVAVGLGTLINTVMIGVAIDLTLFVVDQPASMGGRVAMTLVGPLLVALGTGLYLGVRFGPGPRDGFMNALSERGVPLWLARFCIEAFPFVIGTLLGGNIGWGTVYWLLAIGPAVHFMVPLFARPPVQSRLIDVFNASARNR